MCSCHRQSCSHLPRHTSCSLCGPAGDENAAHAFLDSISGKAPQCVPVCVMLFHDLQCTSRFGHSECVRYWIDRNAQIERFVLFRYRSKYRDRPDITTSAFATREVWCRRMSTRWSRTERSAARCPVTDSSVEETFNTSFSETGAGKHAPCGLCQS